MIPTILHFIWLGPLKIPTVIETWREMHPKWTINIWKDEDINSDRFINKAIYDLPNKKYNQKSDIARLEILYRYGGVYVDADILSVKPIDKLLQNTDLFLFQEKLGLLSNSIIGSSVKNRTILNLIKHIKTNFTVEESVWKSTGPGIITTFLTDRKLIRIPASHSQYDITSRTKSLVIYPYYYINFMTDVIKQCRFKPLTIDMIHNTPINKDLKYIKFNKVDKNNIYGVQLWMGGRKDNYRKVLNIYLILLNLYLYLNTVV